MIGVHVLDDLSTQICHAVAAQAVFVYWHHGMNEFQYFTMQDTTGIIKSCAIYETNASEVLSPV